MCRQGTLSSLAFRSVRYGGAVEAALAARALGLLSLTLGAGDDSERWAVLTSLLSPILGGIHLNVSQIEYLPCKLIVVVLLNILRSKPSRHNVQHP